MSLKKMTKVIRLPDQLHEIYRIKQVFIYMISK
jgi:hypothetical protein